MGPYRRLALAQRGHDVGGAPYFVDIGRSGDENELVDAGVSNRSEAISYRGGARERRQRGQAARSVVAKDAQIGERVLAHRVNRAGTEPEPGAALEKWRT